MVKLHLSPLYEKSDLVADDGNLRIIFHSSQKDNYRVVFAQEGLNTYAEVSVILDRDERKYIFVDVIFNNTTLTTNDIKETLKEINTNFFRVFP